MKTNWTQFLDYYEANFKKISGGTATWKYEVEKMEWDQLRAAMETIAELNADRQDSGQTKIYPDLKLIQRRYEKLNAKSSKLPPCSTCRNSGYVFCITTETGEIIHPASGRRIMVGEMGTGVRAIACICERGSGKGYTWHQRNEAAKKCFGDYRAAIDYVDNNKEQVQQ